MQAEHDTKPVLHGPCLNLGAVGLLDLKCKILLSGLGQIVNFFIL